MTRHAAAAAYVAAALHVLASVALIVVLADGLPPHSDRERQAFMQSHRALWIGGWLLWQLTAISLAVFFRMLQRVVPFAIVLAAATIDIACEAIFAFILPWSTSFAALDRSLEILMGGVANGLYTIAIGMLVASEGVPWMLRVVASPVIVAGVALSAGSFANASWLSIAASAVLFPLFALWLVLAGRWLRKEG